MGIAKARDLKGGQNHVIAVIGDGAMSGGLAYEALNNAAKENTNLIVILNDNEMSISNNVGAMSRYLTHLRTDSAYIQAKESFQNIGPINGHNLSELNEVFQNVKQMRGPLLIHVKTKKGKGYRYAEQQPSKYHGVSKFDMKTGELIGVTDKQDYSAVFGKKLTELAEKNTNILVQDFWIFKKNFQKDFLMLPLQNSMV